MMTGLLPHLILLSFRTDVYYLVPKIGLVDTVYKLVCFKHTGPLHEALKYNLVTCNAKLCTNGKGIKTTLQGMVWKATRLYLCSVLPQLLYSKKVDFCFTFVLQGFIQNQVIHELLAFFVPTLTILQQIRQ